MRKSKKLPIKAAIISLALLSFMPFSCACSETEVIEEPFHFRFDGAELGSSPLTPPTTQVAEAIGMVSYTYTARDCSVLRLSVSPSFNSGITVPAVNGTATYSEVKFASASSRLTASPYRYAKSYYRDSDDVLWSSDTTSLYREANAWGTVSESYTSGNILTSYKAFKMDAEENDDVYISAAYKGECATFNANQCEGVSGVAVNVSKKLSGELSLEVGGITFYFRLRVGTIQIRASERITLGDEVTNYTDYGAVVLCIV